MSDRHTTTATRLNVYIQGQGFPILGLHGHPGTGRSLSVFTNHLSKRYKTWIWQKSLQRQF